METTRTEGYTICGKAEGFAWPSGRSGIEEGTVLWLAKADGYPQWTKKEHDAHWFDGIADALDTAKHSIGMPYYHLATGFLACTRVKIETIQLFHIAKEQTISESKYEINYK